MYTRAGAALLVLLVGAPLWSARADPTAQAPQPLFSIVGADRVLLRRSAQDQSSAVYSLAIAPPAGVDLTRWTPSVIATVRDGSIQAIREAAVVPQLLAGDATHPPRLQLAVELGKLDDPGTYEVSIGFFAKPAPAGGNAPATGNAPAGGTTPTGGDAAAPAPVVVKLVVPAAQLGAPASVHIFRALPLWGDDDERPLPVTLSETGRSAPLRVSVKPGLLTFDDHPTGAVLALGEGAAAESGKPVGLVIAAGQDASIALRVTGDVPVGTTRGNLVINGPDLAAAVTVPVEIRTRRSLWLIPLVFVAGAVLGLVWRYASQRRKQQLEKQARVRDVLDQSTELERGYPATWRTDLTDLIAARDRLVRWTDPPEDALTATEQALTAAIATRATKRTTLLARIAEAREATLPSRYLPAGVDLVPIARGFQAAYDHAIAGDLGRAIDLAIDVSQRLAVLITTTQTWARTLGATFAAIKDGVPECPKDAREPVKAAIDRAIGSTGKLDAVSQADVVTADAPVRPRLDALQSARLDADAVAAALVEGLAATDAAITRLDGAVSDVVRQRIHSAASVTEVPGRPERTIAAALAACSKLAGEVGTAVDAAHPGGRPPEVTALLAAGDYCAALVWRPAGKAPGAPVAFTQDILESSPAGIAANAVAAVVRHVSPAPQSAVGEPALPRFVPADRQPPRTSVAILRELAWWVRLGWVISAAVAAIAVWTIYGGSFVGTRVELFGLFTTGFATDLAAGTKLEELIGKIKTPGTG